MKNLVRLAVKYHAFLLFALLECVSFYLIYKNSFFQHDFMVSSANGLAGNIFEQRSRLSEYLRLSEINSQLAEENARLKVLDKGNYIELGAEKQVFSDTVRALRFEYISARVINNSFNKPNNYLTLDKGRMHGIAPEMAVVAGGALVGIVKNVSEHFSTVLPAINVTFQTGVKMKRTSEPGLFSWNGRDPLLAQVKNVPKHAKVEPGDTVLTAANSKHFPENLPVGIVTAASIPAGASFYDVDIALSASFTKLQFVEVISDRMRTELDELENMNP